MKYHKDPSRISNSGLKLINKSPGHYYYNYFVSKEDNTTPALEFGAALHCMAFEPGEFMKRYIVSIENYDRRTTYGKQTHKNYIEAGQGKKIISKNDFEVMSGMFESLNKNHVYKNLINKGGFAEKVFLFTDPVTGEPCKIKMDYVTPCHIGADLKTCEDASAEGFNKAAYIYDYHQQNAFYSDGYNLATNNPLKAFIFFAIEKVAPYAVGVYTLSELIIDEGRQKYRQALNLYAECKKTNSWPTYPPTIKKILHWSEKTT